MRALHAAAAELIKPMPLNIDGALAALLHDLGFQPEAGKLLAWSNLRADGTPNPSTLHHAMKVRAGCKYVITKWFRERPWGW